MSDSRSAMTPAGTLSLPITTVGSAEFDWTESLSRHAVLVVAVLAIVASVTGLMNGFALDDVHMIVENTRVHALGNIPYLFGQTYWPPLEGASLYRPLTVLAFTLEWAAGHGSPLPFHIVSIALYALACVTLFRLARILVEPGVALLASALFAVHPVHTEAVANVVGQAELIVAILLFVATERYISARRSGSFSRRDVGVIVGCYIGGCLSKEHAIILPGLLAASEVLVRQPGESMKERVRQTGVTFLVLCLIAIGFVILRTTVVGAFRAGGTNELLGGEPFSARALTMLNITLEWLRLLFWPAQLSADYSFPRTRLATGFEATMVPALLVIAGCAVLAWKSRREKPVVTFAILWIAITMAIPSNLIMITGFVLAERTLFLASGAVAIVVAMGIVALWHRIDDSEENAKRFLQLAVAALVIGGAARSAMRNPVWKDNEALFRQTVEDVPFSSRAHWMLAEHYALSGRQGPGADEMLLAVVLGRKDDFILLRFAGDQLSRGGMCNRAMPLYRRALALTPHVVPLRANAAVCLLQLGRIAEARALALAGMKPGTKAARLEEVVAIADSLTAVAGRRTRSRER